jgi:hypothetical protein
LAHVPDVQIMAQAREYYAAHEEQLIAQAIETVRNDPQLRTLAEREARERAKRRKREELF